MRLGRLACVAVAVGGCGGGNGGSTPPPPPPPPGQVASVVITSPSGAQTIGACGTVSFTAQARDAQGNALTSAGITWNSTPSNVSFPTATGSSTTGIGTSIGSASVTAASGTVTSSGVNVTIQGGGAGTTADVAATASSTFSPRCVTITAGGTVSWAFAPDPAHNVIFEPNKPTGGDIGTTQGTTVSRTFPNAGTYRYTCNLHAGMNGWVVVQ
jgi:plastocyanin